MARKTNPFADTLQETMAHYVLWRDDNDIRLLRKNGWNNVTDAYFGKLPDDWPYLSKVTDPRIRTSLMEKNSRLLNAKLRGRLVPREGGDVLKARLNNALLDFQWDSANYAGTMLSKWSTMDLNTRLYGSTFALVYWRHCEEGEKVVFDGNEFLVLDIRDCGIDPTSTGIKDAKWFQHRRWAKVEDLEYESDTGDEEPYPGLKLLKQRMSERSQDRRDNEYVSRIKSLKGLEDRVGEDKSFPVVELVTEYRKDRWITFAPKYKVILRDIENPYDHGKIPIVQLRYYPLSDDPLGESEVEPVLGLWRAIQATVCGFLDEMNIKMRPPIKILEGAVRMETIIFGPEAQWIVDRPDAVTEYQSNGETIRYFQTTYSALTAAFNTAMGDASQGVGSVDPFNPDKTATEIKYTAKQQNARDQNNQMYLAEAIQDMMLMWLSNNKQFLFVDPSKKEYILRIVGSDNFNYFLRSGLDEMEVPTESMEQIGEIIQLQEGNVSDQDILDMIESAKVPKHPIIENPTEKNPEKLKYRPKMTVNDMGDGAEISLVPEDVDGFYDYVADVRSMSSGADAMLSESRQKAVELLTTNPTVLTLLQQEGVRPAIKEALVAVLEDGGLRDAERFFTQLEQSPIAGGVAGGNGPTQPMAIEGVPGQAPPQAQAGFNPAMAGPAQIPQSGGIQPGIQ